jgi:hypothetical protein
MTIRNSPTRAIGLAVALSLVTAYGADAQDTTRTRSSTRIPVRKEAGGAVATTPMVQTRVDTVTLTRVDTVTRTETQTVTRFDTVTVTREVMPTFRYPGGFYIGLAGGASAPQGNVRDSYKTGYNVLVPLGWQSSSGTVALQLDLGYTRLTGRHFAPRAGIDPAEGNEIANSDPQVWSGIANLKLKAPLGGPRRPALYGIVGGGAYKFDNYAGFDNAGLSLAATTDRRLASRTQLDNVSDIQGGANAGVGVSWMLGNAEWFLESRYHAVFTSGAATRWVPINVGVNFFGRGSNAP